jgi:MinD-like ATPase involved in chromosome partitioning or flagellar assembly
MTLVAVASAKGSPGVTTLASALAAVWPRRAILAECDPAGSDLALRLRDPVGGWLARDRGLLALATLPQVDDGGGDGVAAEACLQTVAGGIEVLLGVPSCLHAAALTGSWSRLGSQLSTWPDADVVADCGRIWPDAPQLPVVTAADLVLLLTTASPEAIAHTRSVLALLRRDLSEHRVAVVVVAPEPVGHVAHHVDEALADGGCPERVLAIVANDPRAAAAMAGIPTRGLDRSALIHSVRRLAQQADSWLAARPFASVYAAEVVTATATPALQQGVAAGWPETVPHRGVPA